MKKLLVLIIMSCWVCNISPVSAQEIGSEDLTYMAEDYPPANYVENGELKGASVETLRLMWQKMGAPEQPIRIVPWARGYRMIQTLERHVLFTMSRTEEREDLFKWVGPIFTARHVLIGLADANITLHSLEEAKQYRIGTIRDDIGETSLLNMGFDRENLDSVASLEQNIRKLLAGRVDFISQSESSVRKFLEMSPEYDPAQFKTYFVINEMGNYYAFHKATPDSLIRKFQKAFDSLEQERLEILQKYDMSP